MKAQSILLVIILALATYAAFISLKQPDRYLGSVVYDVHVINGFSDNSSMPLVVWCSSSADDDIGGRALQEGDEFSWSVKTIFWANIKFRCTMKFDRRRRRFEAFRRSRDVERCNPTRHCFWLVKKDGFYFGNDGINWRKDFSWTM
ncbi:PREDICTED: uncharacterized protein LOC109161915 [Ipomoea nil]|uniref:uncharacterized protein LOC109161915 n=1 Tax=Ipomoea nil TaxID=35883 RepID=UPI000900CAB0|nr:PREDICTED: uncharacterized protein LOC109161915 [Ipomoea nil]